LWYAAVRDGARRVAAVGRGRRVSGPAIGGMALGRFAFLLHPPSVDYFQFKFPWMRRVPPRWIEAGFRHVPPWVGAHITGIESPTGATAEGHFIILPWTPRLLLETPWPVTLSRLLAAGHLAEKAGAQIFGLGAYTKIAGDRGVSLHAGLSIPVTTGNSYTAATAVEGALLAAERMGHRPGDTLVTIVGATGSIGAACARVLAGQVGALCLVARERGRLDALREELEAAGASARVETDLQRAVAPAGIVLCVSSAIEGILRPEDFAPGAVVCDVARPRNVSASLAGARDDVLVIDGGVIAVPGAHADFGMNFGFPPRTAEACIAETIILALEERWEAFTLGREITAAQVREIAALGRRHGFRLAGFRRFERAIPDEEIEAIAARARRSA
jgi:fatty aldehyde-generating acyl-ACP reductase